MRRVAAVVLAIAACLAGVTARGEPLTQNSQVYAALQAGRYQEVEAFYDKLRRERKRGPDGKFLFEEFYRSVYWYSTDDPGGAPSWAEVDAHTRDWVSKAPRSHLAAMTRAFSLAYRAEHVQSTGNWGEADKLVAEARKLMDRTQTTGAADPLWHATRLRVAAVEGLPHTDVVDLIHAAVAVDPYPLRLWQEAAIALSPDGTNSDDLAWLMRLALQRTAAQEGTSMYARVLNETFWHFRDFRASPFARAAVDWKVLQASFVDWSKRYPSAYSIDLHATLACAASDRPVTTELLRRIGAAPRMNVWELMGGKGFLARCQEWVKPVLLPQTKT